MILHARIAWHDVPIIILHCSFADLARLFWGSRGNAFIYQLNSPFLDTIDIVRQRTMRNNTSEAKTEWLHNSSCNCFDDAVHEECYRLSKLKTLTNRLFCRRFFFFFSYKSTKISAAIALRLVTIFRYLFFFYIRYIWFDCFLTQVVVWRLKLVEI